MESREEEQESDDDIQPCKCTESRAVQTSSYTSFSIESILGLNAASCKSSQQQISSIIPAAARPCGIGVDKSAAVYPALAECSTGGCTAQTTVLHTPTGQYSESMQACCRTAYGVDVI